MKKLGKIFLVLTLFFVSALPSMAQTEIFAIGTEFLQKLDPIDGPPTVETNVLPFFDSVLYSLDPNTGQPTEIGVIEGYTRCTGLDIHPQTGEFFAVCIISEINGEPGLLTNNGVFINYLLKLNPDTGQPTEVGLLELSRGDFVSDISFRSDGTLFAHLNAQFFDEAEVVANTIGANSLAIINTDNANVNILGETGVKDNFSAIGFTDTDTLLQCTDNENIPGSVYTLNQTTGQGTFLEDLVYPIEFLGGNLISSKDFDLFNDQFFAILNHEGFNPPAPMVETNGLIDGQFLITINQDSGLIDSIGFIADPENQFGAIAVRGQAPPIAEVPTLSEYGLIVTVVMLLGAAVLFLRRRQVKTEI